MKDQTSGPQRVFVPHTDTGETVCDRDHMELLDEFVILPGFFQRLMIDDLPRSCSLSVCLISAKRNNEVLWLARFIFDLSTTHFFPKQKARDFPKPGPCCVCEVGILFISSH